MSIQQFTVMFELDDSPAIVDQQTFEVALSMAIRKYDSKSVDWLNYRIRRMVLTDAKTIEE